MCGTVIAVVFDLPVFLVLAVLAMNSLSLVGFSIFMLLAPMRSRPSKTALATRVAAGLISWSILFLPHILARLQNMGWEEAFAASVVVGAYGIGLAVLDFAGRNSFANAGGKNTPEDRPTDGDPDPDTPAPENGD